METAPDHLIRRARELGWSLPEPVAERLSRYVELLLTWSRRINLIGPRAKRRLWEEHLAPSLWLADKLPERGGTVADLGSGAGLPGLVLACLDPRLGIDLFEARAKRVSFLKTAAAELGLDGVGVFKARVPETAPGYAQGAYGVVICRAVAALTELLPPAGWLLSAGGRLIALKGPAGRDEAASLAADPAGGGWRLAGIEARRFYGRTTTLIELAKVD